MLIDQILQQLDETGGNVPVVADNLAVSHSYVYRVKRENWNGTTASVADPVETLIPDEEPEEIVDSSTTALVPRDEIVERLLPNIKAVRHLRDLTLNKLVELIDNGMLSHKELVAVLRALLKYEQDAEALLRPALNLYDQRRQQTNIAVGGELFSRLSNMDTDQLRALSGVDAPPIIEVIENVDNSERNGLD